MVYASIAVIAVSVITVTSIWFYEIFDWRKCKRKFDPLGFCGAGNVNHWPGTARQETAKLAKAGIPCYHVEVFGWADTKMLHKPKYVKKKLKETLFWCKRRKIAFFGSVVNDNIHLAKYGNTPTDLGEYLGAIRQIMVMLEKAAKKQIVLIQPVGETQTRAGKEIEQMAIDLIPKKFLVANTGSRPKSVPAWASFAAFHAPRTADPVPRGLWDVTDHGTILNEMGGTGAQVFKNDVIEADARRAKNSGNPYILYGFQVKKLDKGNLNAIANGYYH